MHVHLQDGESYVERSPVSFYQDQKDYMHDRSCDLRPCTTLNQASSAPFVHPIPREAKSKSKGWNPNSELRFRLESFFSHPRRVVAEIDPRFWLLELANRSKHLRLPVGPVVVRVCPPATSDTLRWRVHRIFTTCDATTAVSSAEPRIRRRRDPRSAQFLSTAVLSYWILLATQAREVDEGRRDGPRSNTQASRNVLEVILG